MSASSSVETSRWSFPTRVAFRFIFCFFGLFFFPFPLDLIPAVGDLWARVWTPVVTGAGSAIFGVTVDTAFNGSGDKTYNWVQLFVIAAVSTLATLVWSIVDRKATSYPRLQAWFRVYLRFALALAMISYGAFKVIPSQFVAPSLDRLMQPFGDASPMGLLWTFMGASMPYTIFTGIGELTGGLLLTMRRTALLGALITAAVMLHVAVLNFTYDVPVKIYATLLFLAALVIAAPDAKRLFAFFLGTPPDSLFQRRPLQLAARVVALLFVGAMLAMSLKMSWTQRKMIQETRLGKTPLYGIWDVDELTVDGVARPPLTTDRTRWRRLVVSGKEWGSMQMMDDSRARLTLKINSRELMLTRRPELTPMAFFTYELRGPGTLILDGTFDGKKTNATLHKAASREFLLNTRGFHWINEVPFNR